LNLATASEARSLGSASREPRQVSCSSCGVQQARSSATARTEPWRSCGARDKNEGSL